MKVVVDASVALKWILSPIDEPDADRAERLLFASRRREVLLAAPPHWAAEILAVAARRVPERVPAALDLIYGLDVMTHATRLTYLYAARMSSELNHHLFDTFYHAVAIEIDGEFVTADQRYFAKAERLG